MKNGLGGVGLRQIEDKERFYPDWTSRRMKEELGTAKFPSRVEPVFGRKKERNFEEFTK